MSVTAGDAQMYYYHHHHHHLSSLDVASVMGGSRRGKPSLLHSKVESSSLSLSYR